jgi:hypothetical protein
MLDIEKLGVRTACFDSNDFQVAIVQEYDVIESRPGATKIDCEAFDQHAAADNTGTDLDKFRV